MDDKSLKEEDKIVKGNTELEEHKLGFIDKIKNSFRSKKFKGGAYATTISSVVIALVIIVNLFATELDIKVDMTSDARYSLTDETISMLNQIGDKITIYFLAQAGTENETFKKIVENYEKVSDNISLVYKDPVQYPKFASQYVDDTIQEQSFIVVNETNGRAKYIDYEDMLLTEMNYETYQQSVTGIDVEGRVDAAIQYVTNEDLPMIYEIEGHGETALTTTVTDILSKANISSEKINTLTGNDIPEECDVLYINHPQSDYSEDELKLIAAYLEKGGDAIINLDYNTVDLPNFSAFITDYGIDIVPGIVLEGDSSHYNSNNITNLIPNVISNDFTSEFRNKKFVIAPVATGLQIREDMDESVTANKILNTTDSAYSKTDMNSQTVEKEDGDIDGPFEIGLELVKGTDDTESRVVLYSSYLFDETYLAETSIANQDLFINTINSLTEQENTLNIRTTSVSEETLVVTSAQANQMGVVTAALIPLIFIATGVVVTVQRRKR